jgi:hypothetical protein
MFVKFRDLGVGHPLPPEIIFWYQFLFGTVKSQGLVLLGRLGILKKFSDLIRIRTRDLSAYIKAPRQCTDPCAHDGIFVLIESNVWIHRLALKGHCLNFWIWGSRRSRRLYNYSGCGKQLMFRRPLLKRSSFHLRPLGFCYDPTPVWNPFLRR